MPARRERRPSFARPRADRACPTTRTPGDSLVTAPHGLARSTAHGGHIRALGRTIDWQHTALGPPDDWPPALRAVARSALDSPFPICLWCGPELILVYNDAYRAVLGNKHPGALGRPGPEVWAEIWPQIRGMFEQIRHGGPAIHAEDAPFVVRRADEPADAAAREEPNAWFTFSLSPVRDESGEIVAFLNIVSESTARVLADLGSDMALARAERAEARLREVFAQAPAFMAVLRGEEFVFEYVNEAYYQLVGHRPLVGRPVWEALPDIRGQGFERLLERVLRQGEPYIGTEVAVQIRRTPDSEPEQRFVDLVYYPITEADGTRAGIVAHGSDVTDHVLARREAQRARAEAEQANEAKSQFLAMMSHEIRTPINAVIGYTDLLESGMVGELSERQKEFLERVRQSSNHLLSLIDEVLDLAKIEAGEMMVAMGGHPLEPVVRSALEMVAPQVEAAGLELTESWECERGIRFGGDTDRLRQVLLNLLSNATKFTDAGGRVRLRCRVEAGAAPPAAASEEGEQGPWIVLDVEDTGRGIAPDQLEHVFEPFAQAETDPPRHAGGTGLGLTISRRLSRLMGGDLTVRSAAGAGSTFSVWLRPAD